MTGNLLLFFYIFLNFFKIYKPIGRSRLNHFHPMVKIVFLGRYQSGTVEFSLFHIYIKLGGGGEMGHKTEREVTEGGGL